MEYLRERGVGGTIEFAIPKIDDTDLAATGDWTPATGDIKISSEAGNVANATNLPTAVGGTGSVLWTWTYTAGEADAERIAVQIVDSAVENQTLYISFMLGAQISANKGIITGSVDDTDFTPTTTACEANRLAPNTTEETTADHFNGGIILFTSGVALGQKSAITDYVLANSKEKFTYSAIATAPADGDTFVIL